METVQLQVDLVWVIFEKPFFELLVHIRFVL